MIRLLFCVFTLIANVASEGCFFGYKGDHGVDHWGESYSDCLGKHQSPINIDSELVTFADLPPFEFNGFDVTSAASLTNNGHTAMMNINCGTKPTISGGPLGGVYEFAQLHFHWGNDNTCGCENEIDNKQYPLEMHIVFYKKEYSDVNSALAHPDGLCVLGCLFETEEKHNRNYRGIVSALKNITQAGTVQKIDNPPALFQLIPRDFSTYFTYHGSLTTPPCSEAVTWIEFDNTVKISDEQLQAFRDLKDEERTPLVNNFRAIQPLGDRVVLYRKNGI